MGKTFVQQYFRGGGLAPERKNNSGGVCFPKLYKALDFPVFNYKKAFSVAEAMITLLIVSIAMAASAPIITKQVKLSSEKQTMPSGMIAYFNRPCNQISGGWNDVPGAWQGRYPRIAGNYQICDKQGENADGQCVGEGKAASAAVNELQGDAIRNLRGAVYEVKVPHDKGSGSEGVLTWTYGYWTKGHDGGGNSSGTLAIDASRTVPVADENRVKSVALYMCVKD